MPRGEVEASCTPPFGCWVMEASCVTLFLRYLELLFEIRPKNKAPYEARKIYSRWLRKSIKCVEGGLGCTLNEPLGNTFPRLEGFHIRRVEVEPLTIHAL